VVTVSWILKGVIRTVPQRASKRSLQRLHSHRISAERKVFEVLVNPTHDDKSEAEKAALAGMAPRTWRKYRTPEAVRAALQARRAAYARHLPAIDAALIGKAKEGSLGHILLAYERIEGWRPGGRGVEKGTEVVDGALWHALSQDERAQIAEVISRAYRRRHLVRAEPTEE